MKRFVVACATLIAALALARGSSAQDLIVTNARILDGKRIAQELLERVRVGVDARRAHGLAAPGLAVVLVGDDAASSVYVRNKRKACHQVGFRSFDHDLPTTVTQDKHVEGLPLDAYGWYLDLRKYGTFVHSGFGLGLERTVAWICGTPHIRETSAFPRLMNRLRP